MLAIAAINIFDIIRGSTYRTVNNSIGCVWENNHCICSVKMKYGISFLICI